MSDVQANPLGEDSSLSPESKLRQRGSASGDADAAGESDDASPDRSEEPMEPRVWTSGWLMADSMAVGDSLRTVAEEPDIWTEDHDLLVSGWLETGSVLREAQESLEFDSVSFWWEWTVHMFAPVSQVIMVGQTLRGSPPLLPARR